jgi:hypothetical protein
MAATTDGGLVIAGARGVARALGINARGEIKWSYAEPRDELIKNINDTQSIFNGVVSLGNGNTFLCGTKNSADGHTTGLITLLDANGQVISRRLERPSGRIDPSWTWS